MTAGAHTPKEEAAAAALQGALEHADAPLLEVQNLQMRFGGLLAVDALAMQVRSGQIVSLIGPNGAGKTTVFNCLTGFYKPSGGRILLGGERIDGLPGHAIARRGVVRTFQNVRLFRDMTVVENLLVAQHRHLNRSYLAGLLKTPSFRRSEREALDAAAAWLERMHLLDVANRPAGTLPYGQQRKLEIARCMMTRPSLLMLDEPAAGLNPHETAELEQLIGELRDEFSLTVLLIEHDMRLVMSISDYIYVINQGRPLAEGEPEAVRQHPDVIKAYLGED